MWEISPAIALRAVKNGIRKVTDPPKTQTLWSAETEERHRPAELECEAGRRPAGRVPLAKSIRLDCKKAGRRQDGEAAVGQQRPSKVRWWLK